MQPEKQKQLISVAKSEISSQDPSHDFRHALRVYKTARKIAKAEKADLDIVVPAALFHDLITYPKHDTKSDFEQDESAAKAHVILSKIDWYPDEKIRQVKKCIKECSFRKGIKHDNLEGMVIQDADGLEATGAISIMRTFASTGNWSRPFYHINDPFLRNRQPNAKQYALDLFYERLLKVEERMYTNTAKMMAKRRTKFLREFLAQLKDELNNKT